VLLSQEVEGHKRRERREWALKRLRFCGGAEFTKLTSSFISGLKWTWSYGLITFLPENITFCGGGEDLRNGPRLLFLDLSVPGRRV